MAAPLPLRDDFTAADLRLAARRSCDANQARRLLALAVIHDGGARADAARLGGVALRIVRDWVVRFNADGPAGLLDRKAPGPSRRLGEAQRKALIAMVENGPNPAVHGLVRWSLADLTQWLLEEFRVSISVDTVGRELRRLGYRKLSARPRHHAKGPASPEAFKKLPRRTGGSRAWCRRWQAHRDLVPGRSPHRPEERHHPAPGPARLSAARDLPMPIATPAPPGIRSLHSLKLRSMAIVQLKVRWSVAHAACTRCFGTTNSLGASSAGDVSFFSMYPRPQTVVTISPAPKV